MSLVKQSHEGTNGRVFQNMPDLFDHHPVHGREGSTHELLPLPPVNFFASIVPTIETTEPLGQFVSDLDGMDFGEVAESLEFEEDA